MRNKLRISSQFLKYESDIFDELKLHIKLE